MGTDIEHLGEYQYMFLHFDMDRNDHKVEIGTKLRQSQERNGTFLGETNVYE